MRNDYSNLLMPLIAAAITVCLNGNAYAAGELVFHYEQARMYEAQFQAAKAEREANVASSKVAGSAMFPELRISNSRFETENSTRTTVAVIQPVVDVNRYASVRESEPRELLADATYQAREQELAQRYMKNVSELVRARESLLLNQARINAFEQQALSAQKGYELGTGTVTDLRDAQVRLDQARAVDFTLRARLEAAERQFQSITGVLPRVETFKLARKPPQLSLKSVDEYLTKAMQDNAQLNAARQNEQIGQLGVTRAKGAFVPTVNVTATHTHTSLNSDKYIGVQVNFPLQAGSIYQVSGALANAQRLSEQTRDLELKTRLEVERLRQLVEAGRAEVAIRLQGIQSAELSVEANEKSFHGGVRSKVDVINSIQILYQVKEEHLNAVLTLAENLLNLHIQLANPVPDSLLQIEEILFSRG
jgi:protease secretion system outer membrane protein